MVHQGNLPKAWKNQKKDSNKDESAWNIFKLKMTELKKKIHHVVNNFFGDGLALCLDNSIEEVQELQAISTKSET